MATAPSNSSPSTPVRSRRHRLARVLGVVAVLAAGVQAYVIHEISRQVLAPTNRRQGGLSLSDAFSTAGPDPERFDRMWFSAHHAVEMPDASATLHAWRFDPAALAGQPHAARAGALVIPGWGGSALDSDYLHPLALLLREEGARVFLVDPRGQGCSTGDTCSHGYLDATDLRHLADELRRRGELTGPLLLAGHSYGAITVLQAAPRIPETAGVLAFSGPRDLLSVGHSARKLASDTFPLLYPAARPFLSDFAFGVAVRRAARRHGFDAEECSAENALRRLRVPILIAHGAADAHVPVANARALHAARPDRTELLVFPNADHWSYLDDPAELKRVRAWVRTVLEPGTPPATGS